jgi:hypothetical protein
MTAEEMFNELGYKNYKLNPSTDISPCLFSGETPIISYLNNGEKKYVFRYINFLEDKTVEKCCDMTRNNITIQELKAINKQCEELGWI